MQKDFIKKMRTGHNLRSFISHCIPIHGLWEGEEGKEVQQKMSTQTDLLEL